MRRSAAFAVLLCLFLAAAAAAQERGNIGVYYFIKAKPGHGPQLAEGLKKHREFHQKAGDKFTWVAWQVETGPATGTFMVGSYGHNWKDFEAQDALGEKDAADVAINITPHEESVSAAYWAFIPDLSLADESGPPSKFLAITDYFLKPDKVAQFREVISKVNDAIRKQDPQGRRRARWYVLVSGGEGPTYALVQERDSWADFANTGQSLAQIVDATYGKEEGDRLRAAFQGSYTRTTSMLVRYRPDLSSPAAAK